MAYDKKTFLKNVTILCDDREKENSHVLAGFERLGVKYKTKHLDFGDYSFEAQDRDFSLSCVIERKRNVDELYGNIVRDRDRIEKEFTAAVSIANQFVLLIENCGNLDELEATTIPEYEMRKTGRSVPDIGKYVYATIQSWQCGNRYNFRTVFVKTPEDTAVYMLEVFYWHWRNFKILTAARRNKKS